MSRPDESRETAQEPKGELERFFDALTRSLKRGRWPANAWDGDAAWRVVMYDLPAWVLLRLFEAGKAMGEGQADPFLPALSEMTLCAFMLCAEKNLQPNPPEADRSEIALNVSVHAVLELLRRAKVYEQVEYGNPWTQPHFSASPPHDDALGQVRAWARRCGFDRPLASAIGDACIWFYCEIEMGVMRRDLSGLLHRKFSPPLQADKSETGLPVTGSPDTEAG